MASDEPNRNGFDRVTDNHSAIRRWARQRGGRPGKAIDTEGEKGDHGRPTISFPDSDEEGVERIEWEEFFSLLDSKGLVLAYKTDTDAGRSDRSFALIDSDRASKATDSNQAQAEPTPEKGGTEKHGEADPESDSLAREAKDDANADAHRDEPPFNS